MIAEELMVGDFVNYQNNPIRVEEILKSGEYCISDTPGNAIQGLIDCYEKNIKIAQKKIKEWKKEWKELLKHIK